MPKVTIEDITTPKEKQLRKKCFGWKRGWLRFVFFSPLSVTLCPSFSGAFRSRGVGPRILLSAVIKQRGGSCEGVVDIPAAPCSRISMHSVLSAKRLHRPRGGHRFIAWRQEPQLSTVRGHA